MRMLKRSVYKVEELYDKGQMEWKALNRKLETSLKLLNLKLDH